MSWPLDKTHDPQTVSWVASANIEGTDFPIQNLPFGVFRRKGGEDAPRVGVAIGEDVLDVAACVGAVEFREPAAAAARACDEPTLNRLLETGPDGWTALRRRLHALLRADSPDSGENRRKLAERLYPQADVALFKPVEIGNYTDFYASIDHATNVGKLFRPTNPLLPNYKYVPIGYHGRASSIVVSGTPVSRPKGQVRRSAAGAPSFEPTGRLDYELEVGFLVGAGNALGERISVDDATKHVFGACLVNDWSARDIQAWEYQPLGPFLGKSFATTISGWVVTLDALAPYRVPALQRPEGDPAPLPYLFSRADQSSGGFDVVLEVSISTPEMREQRLAPVRLSRSRLSQLYWTMAQMVAHHTSNGCNLCPGDLLATGTVSGPTPNSRGCLLELTQNGSEPIDMPMGGHRAFLEDGDEVILRGYCDRPGFRPIGFGECRGVVMPAIS